MLPIIFPCLLVIQRSSLDSVLACPFLVLWSFRTRVTFCPVSLLQAFCVEFAVLSSMHKSRSVVKKFMMIAEPVQELSFWLPQFGKALLHISPSGVTSRIVVCWSSRTREPFDIRLSVFIQCYFTYCVVLAFSAHSMQCDRSCLNRAL